MGFLLLHFDVVLLFMVAVGFVGMSVVCLCFLGGSSFCFLIFVCFLYLFFVVEFLVVLVCFLG